MHMADVLYTYAIPKYFVQFSGTSNSDNLDACKIGATAKLKYNKHPQKLAVRVLGLTHDRLPLHRRPAISSQAQ